MLCQAVGWGGEIKHQDLAEWMGHPKFGTIDEVCHDEHGGSNTMPWLEDSVLNCSLQLNQLLLYPLRLYPLRLQN
jgi:hypothetical protein